MKVSSFACGLVLRVACGRSFRLIKVASGCMLSVLEVFRVVVRYFGYLSSHVHGTL